MTTVTIYFLACIYAFTEKMQRKLVQSVICIIVMRECASFDQLWKLYYFLTPHIATKRLAIYTLETLKCSLWSVDKIF